MAENNNNRKPAAGGFFNEVWKELMKPPAWAKVPPKPGTAKKEDGKKTEADAPKHKRKRQPPSWWSWSVSDGVPRRRRSPKAKAASSSRSTKPPRSKSPHKSNKKSGGAALSPLSKSTVGDLGSVGKTSLSQLHSQIRKHGYAPSALKPYGLSCTKVEPFGPVLRLRTNQGLVAFKKTDLAPRQVQFLQNAFVHLEQNHFTRYSPFLLTEDDKPYAQVGGDTYYITRWLRGQEVDFRSSQQLALASRTLAEFHEASRGFEAPGYHPPMIFDMVDRFRDRRDELLLWKKQAERKRRPDGVDEFYLKHVDSYVKQCDEALALLRRGEVRSHLLFEEDDPCLCHLDLTPYNMVYGQNRQVYLIDLDFCTYGPRTLDVAHLIRRALQRQEWEEDVAWHILVNYNSLRMLNRAEYRILHGLLLFPHRFWRVAYEHYDVGHDPHHLGYFQLCEAEAANRAKFLERFARRVDRMQ